MNSFSFETIFKSSETNARLGIIHTPHGDIQTPTFIPVGTQATVKSLSPEEIESIGTQMYFVNTYHMAMRPGIDVIEKLGGLHTFMNWNHPVITDSGGFQVFSLANNAALDRNEQNPSLVKITDDGVTFQSHWDGTSHQFTSESSMEFQWKLGSDIHIAFDDCTPYPIDHDGAKKSMERTHAWAIRSLDAHKHLATQTKGPYQAFYGSIQGSIFEDLRKESASFVSALETDGIAIGGVSVGESKEEMKHVLDWVMPILPDDKPRHLLGVGELDDVFMAIEHGIDTFDCVQPSRLARAGYLYTHDEHKRKNKDGIIDLNKTVFALDTSAVDSICHCYTCTHFTRAYIHHLFKVKELLAYRLATIHNIYFMHQLVGDIKTSIKENTFLELKKRWGYNT